MKRLAACVIVTGTLVVSAAADSHFQSSPAARALAVALEQRGLTTIAAADPEEDGRFIAAMYIPGSQLLVVSARQPAAAAMRNRIAMKQYLDAYLDLQGTPDRDGKFFVHDGGADGILAALPANPAVDIVYEDGVRETRFNGDWEAQRLSEKEYQEKLESADARYGRMLKLLLDALGE